MFSKDLSTFFFFIAGQSNFETALATCCAVLLNLKFVTPALVLKSLPTPALDQPRILQNTAEKQGISGIE